MSELRGTIHAGQVADDLDQPIGGVQAPEQIIVLAVGAREERREMAETDAAQAFDATEALQCGRVLRTDAIDQDLVELADLAGAGDRERQHVPERKAQIVDQHLAPRLRMPLVRIERSQQVVDIAGAGIKIDLDGEPLDQPIDLVAVALDERRRIFLQAPDFAGSGL